jgi:hypothetical protein
MPSNSLFAWTNDRLPRLAAVEAQCAACLVVSTPNLLLIEENLRGYVVLLSAHFQGFCRDLYTESAQIIASKVRSSLEVLIQGQFTTHRAIDRGNPTLDAIKRDFGRFGFDLQLSNADPANHQRLQSLSHLNAWRNVAAHHDPVLPTSIALTLPNLRIWQSACDGLARSLDGVMYNQLRRLLRRAPWQP